MGANMARRVKDQGFEIGGLYDLHPEFAKELAAEIGGKACATLAEATSLGDVIVTVVTDEPAMRGIFGLNGEADHLLIEAKGKTFVNCATVAPQVHLDVEQLLRAMSSSLRHVGHTGEAAKFKALVNMVMNINTAGLAEGLALGDALGLDLGTLREVFAQTGANSRVLETDGEDMQNRDHACFFSGAHAAKDSGIALELGKAAGLNLPLAEATKNQYDRMVQAGLGDLDKSGIAELTFKGRGI